MTLLQFNSLEARGKFDGESFFFPGENRSGENFFQLFS